MTPPRAAAVLFTVGVTLAPAPARPQARVEACNSAAIVTPTGVHNRTYFDCLPFGDIVGAQLLDNRFMLYATPPGPRNTPPLLWRDHVIQLSRASTEFRDTFRFSLELDRRGDRKFRTDDIGGVTLFKTIIESRRDPVFDVVRARLGPVLGQIHSGTLTPRIEEGLQKKIANALNAALSDDLESLVIPEHVSDDVRQMIAANPRSARLRRLILEDLFEPALARDVKQAYLMRWRREGSDEASKPLQEIFSAGRIESVFLSADALLKRLESGEDAPADIAFGPTLLSLCVPEIISDVRRGLPFTFDSFGAYFDFDVQSQSAGELAGQALWFRNPTLTVKAAGSGGAEGKPRECSIRFAESLTRNVPGLLADAGAVGQHLRNLTALLTLKRAMDWLIGLTPVDGEFLRRVPTKRIENIPPKVMELPIVFVSGNKPFGIAIVGGIRTGSAPSIRGKVDAIGSPIIPQTPSVDPAFDVTTVDVGGRQLLKIDLSAIVGLTER